MQRILLFGTMGDIGDTVQKELDRSGFCTELVDFPQNTFRDEAGYRRQLIKSVDSFLPQMIIPIGNGLALARFKEELRSYHPEITVCVDEEWKLSLLDSKVRFHQWAHSQGFNVPRTYTSPEQVADIKKVVFKRDVSFGGHGVHFPLTVEALANLIGHQRTSEPYLIQELIEGEDYSVDAIRIGAEAFCSSYHCISSKGMSGPSTRRRITKNDEIESVAKAILDRLDFKGICGFDFRIDCSGKPFLLECNPRFTGGIETQIESGLNLPVLLIRAFAEEK